MTKTLTTERIRDLYTFATAWGGDGAKYMQASNRAEFDSWLAAHDAKVKAEAWRVGWQDGWGDRGRRDDDVTPNPYTKGSTDE